MERRIVRRYAAALFQAASSANAVDRVESDLGLIAYAIENNPRLAEVVQSPLVSADVKKQILGDLFRDKIHAVSMRYIYLLVEKRREEAMLYTEQEYILLANEARGIVNAEVRTAVRMTDEQTLQLTAKLQAVTGKTIHLTKILDPGIIGGVMVRIGDNVIDGSIRGQLDMLREQMIS